MQESKTKATGNSTSSNHGGEDNALSGFIWRTFVGNKKKEDFLRSSIFLLLLINGVFVFFLYSQKTQKSVYVIDSGVPKVASLIGDDVRVDEQVVFFLNMWMKLLTEVSAEDYEENREALKNLSSRELMKRVLAAESATTNRLIKEVMQSETMRLHILDVVIEGISRRGSLIDVDFSQVTEIQVPSGSEKYVTSHKAQMMATNYRVNGVGFVMVEVDNLWKLQRRI
jgi:hypothetical protein